MKKKYLEEFSIVLIFLFMFFLIVNTPIMGKYKNDGKLIINEILASNKGVYQASDDEFYDFIELYNGYDYDINLKDYYLSDDNYNLKKWQFPEVTIKANDYLLVFASGLDKYENDEIHTNFKLSSKGEIVTLSKDNIKVLSKVKYSETIDDTSFGYDGKNYVYFYAPTPLSENTSSKSKDPIEKLEKNEQKLAITKYTFGKNPIIEIYNDEDYDINMKDYYISDTFSDIYKYRFPEVIIKSKDKITIYANGLDKYEKGIVYTNFKLDNESKNIIISDNLKREVTKLNISNNITSKEVRINEVVAIGNDAIELKNLTNEDIVLSNYEISDNSGVLVSLKDVKIKALGYVVLYGSDSYYVDSNVHIGFHINNSNEELYLYKNGSLVDNFKVGRLVSNVSVGINDSNEKVYFKNITLNSENAKEYYKGYSSNVLYSIDGGYVNEKTKISLTTNDGSTIYYTLDGSFPTTASTKYTEPITINKTTVIKTIAYKDNYLPSDTTSRTYFVGRHHNLPVISISTNYNNLYGSSGIITNYTQNVNKIINFEYYESNGKLGVSFVGDTKLSGMDSRKRAQKSMSIFLRKEYGLKEVTYPFFKDSKLKTYSSFLLRNAGEDPKNVRIMDAVLTQTLKGNMDIDIQDYQPVVVYINGEYYGLFNLREKLNADYIVTNYGLDKNGFDLIKYKVVKKGSIDEFYDLVNYVSSHDMSNKENYEYVKSKIDIQELINYVIVQSYYGNTDMGNIRYWKSKDNGKWRFMLYDLDWSLWDTSRNFSYPVFPGSVPAATYLGHVFTITRSLYKNSEFKDLYLKTFAYNLKNTFNPERMNKLIDKYSKEIQDEMPYHIARWQDGPNSYSGWENSLARFKNVIAMRYNVVVSRVKSEFKLTDSEYKKYFGDL